MDVRKEDDRNDQGECASDEEDSMDEGIGLIGLSLFGIT